MINLDHCKSLVIKISTPYHAEEVDVVHYYLDGELPPEARAVATLKENGLLQQPHTSLYQTESDLPITFHQEWLTLWAAVKDYELKKSEKVLILEVDDPVHHKLLSGLTQDDLECTIHNDVRMASGQWEDWDAFELTNFVYETRVDGLGGLLYADIETKLKRPTMGTAKEIYEAGEASIVVTVYSAHCRNGCQQTDNGLSMEIEVLWAPKARQAP